MVLDEYSFMPQKDITAYELALILKSVPNGLVTLDKMIVAHGDTPPDEISRHFVFVKSRDIAAA